MDYLFVIVQNQQKQKQKNKIISGRCDRTLSDGGCTGPGDNYNATVILKDYGLFPKIARVYIPGQINYDCTGSPIKKTGYWSK